MKIETKFNLGDAVWVKYHGETCNFIVKGIMFACDEFQKRITYALAEDAGFPFYYLTEEELTSANEELLKSL